MYSTKSAQRYNDIVWNQQQEVRRQTRIPVSSLLELRAALLARLAARTDSFLVTS